VASKKPKKTAVRRLDVRVAGDLFTAVHAAAAQQDRSVNAFIVRALKVAVQQEEMRPK
jgi:predicted HicB family RNase H-like nuclease